MAMAMLMKASFVLTILSVIFLLVLCYIYLKNLQKIKSKFTYGLLLFAAILLIQNLISLYFYIAMMSYYVPEVEMHVFLLSLLEAIALLILLFITWE